MLKAVASCINTQLRILIMLRYTRCNIVTLMAATAWLMLSLPPHPPGRGRNFLWGHLKSTVHGLYPHTIQELKDNVSHAVAAIKITMLHRLYLNMVTARLLTNSLDTLRN